MLGFKNKYKILVALLPVSIVAVFLGVRPLNSPWHRFIAADGLGYYAYLPAKFIYNDESLSFKWFNDVYKKHYPSGAFENPEDNFLVDYKSKKINKYYQGLSFIWLPFFIVAHWAALLIGLPADGFSAPYQLMMGLASLFYLCIGLYLLGKLLLKLFSNQLVAYCVPVFIFYGTPLFNYALNYNTLSHVYSFCFIVLLIYCVHGFFNENRHKSLFFFCAVLFYFITVSIRPLNALIIVLLPAFIPEGFKLQVGFEKPRLPHYFVLLVLFVLVYYQSRILLLQTGSLFNYTYAGESFNFSRPRFYDALFGYNIGLFVYAPLILLSFFGIGFLTQRKKFILPVFFLAMIFIYSSWWYWPVVKRAIIDYYFIPAVLLSALLKHLRSMFVRQLLLPLLLLLTVYYQFKEMQIRRGVLDEFLTYKEVFWRNFFRIHKTSMYLVPPSSILTKQERTENFENAQTFVNAVNEQKHGGEKSLVVGPQNAVSVISSAPFPQLFNEKERKKIRFSFWMLCEEDIGKVHVFVQFVDKNRNVLREEPFYLNQQDIAAGSWDYKEFGCEAGGALINGAIINRIEFLIWNTEGRKKMWIDDAKVEFILCDESFETNL